MFCFFLLSSRWSVNNLAKGHSCSPCLPQKKVTNFSLEGPTIFLPSAPSSYRVFPIFCVCQISIFQVASSVVPILI